MSQELAAHNPLRAGSLRASRRRISAAVPQPYTKLLPLRLPIRHWQNSCWRQQFRYKLEN